MFTKKWVVLSLGVSVLYWNTSVAEAKKVRLEPLVTVHTFRTEVSNVKIADATVEELPTLVNYDDDCDPEYPCDFKVLEKVKALQVRAYYHDHEPDEYSDSKLTFNIPLSQLSSDFDAFIVDVLSLASPSDRRDIAKLFFKPEVKKVKKVLSSIDYDACPYDTSELADSSDKKERTCPKTTITRDFWEVRLIKITDRLQ